VNIVAIVLAGIVCLLATSFFSGAETGFMSVSRVRLRRQERPDTKRQVQLREMLRNIEDPILTCLIGTNLFNVAFTAIVTAALTISAWAHAEWLAIFVSAVVIISWGEILPKTLFREFPERLTLAAVPMVRSSMKVLAPIRWALLGYTSLLRRALPAEDGPNHGFDRRGLSALLNAHAEPNPRDSRFTAALDRFMALAGHPLTQIMRPVHEVVRVGPDSTVAECLQTAAESGFSRLPVTREDGRDLQAYFLVRDLIFLPREDHDQFVPRKLWRTFLLVDERMSPYELFEELRSQKRQVAVVVDAEGQSLGLITLEDLIEMVMGAVHDEFDERHATAAIS
jgi:putative hemolysin